MDHWKHYILTCTSSRGSLKLSVCKCLVTLIQHNQLSHMKSGIHGHLSAADYKQKDFLNMGRSTNFDVNHGGRDCCQGKVGTLTVKATPSTTMEEGEQAHFHWCISCKIGVTCSYPYKFLFVTQVDTCIQFL